MSRNLLTNKKCVKKKLTNKQEAKNIRIRTSSQTFVCELSRIGGITSLIIYRCPTGILTQSVEFM